MRGGVVAARPHEFPAVTREVGRSVSRPRPVDFAESFVRPVVGAGIKAHTARYEYMWLFGEGDEMGRLTTATVAEFRRLLRERSGR